VTGIVKFDRGPFDQTQFDLVWALGLSYRFKA
jgi:hypothetical protein